MQPTEVGVYLYTRMPHLADFIEIPGVAIQQPPAHGGTGTGGSSADKAARATELERSTRLDSAFARLGAQAPSLAFQRMLARKIAETAREVMEQRGRRV